MTSDLAAWLRQQLDEDERLARAACWDDQSDVWTARPPQARYEQYTVEDYLGDGVVVVAPENADTDAVGQHVAEWDPARVLRAVEAKRALLDELLPPAQDWTVKTDEELHARFAHPDWEYATTSGPRKQWDDCNVPPLDENFEPDTTWERNTDAGRDGWERFDYTEESYWRRRLPADHDQQPAIPGWLRLLAAEYADRPGYRAEWRP